MIMWDIDNGGSYAFIWERYGRNLCKTSAQDCCESKAAQKVIIKSIKKTVTTTKKT